MDKPGSHGSMPIGNRRVGTKLTMPIWSGLAESDFALLTSGRADR
jgi:hypothetical protein